MEQDSGDSATAGNECIEISDIASAAIIDDEDYGYNAIRALLDEAYEEWREENEHE